MEQASYIAVRDSDLDALVESVNEFLEEGYRLAGPLLHVPKSGSKQAVYVQSLVLESRKDRNGDRKQQGDARPDWREESCAPARWSIARPALRR
jgi:hypothetical protein